MDEEQRDVEIGSLSAIFPEIQVDEKDPHTISLEIPVKPNKSVTVFFPAANDGLNPTVAPLPEAAPAAGPIPAVAAAVEDSHQLEYLPSIRLQVTLPKDYPETEPPRATISTNPPWLPQEVAKRLEEDGPRLWEEFGRDLVVFTYIDQIQQAAEDVFGLVSDTGALQVDSEHKIAILDHDIKAKRETFDKATFDCGICIEPKKGAVCHSMTACGHVFCKQCLCDFYNNAIKEGDLASIRCLEPSCGKKREAAYKASGKTGRKPKLAIAPGELLQMSLEPETVQRYVKLKYKNELESDRNTVYCPRSWCGGAARSSHKRQGLDSVDDESDDSNAEDEDDKGPTSLRNMDRLAICEDCGFAFCAWCKLSWHGELVSCAPRRDNAPITEEEQASLDYLVEHTTQCPTCNARAQKINGCNHMICYRCQSHFCYLCAAWLSSDNPYQHYNEQPNGKRTSCYMRLWELEEGDGPNEDFRRPLLRAAPAAEQIDHRAVFIPAPAPAPIIEIEEPDDEAAVNANAGGVEVEREGALVLRIAGGVVPPPAPAPPAPVPRGQRRRRGGANPQANQQPARGQAPGRGGAGPQRGRGGRNQPGAGDQARRGIGRRELNGEDIAPEVAGIIPRDMPRGPGPRINAGLRAIGGGDGDGVVDPAMGDWIRQFVQQALDDEEDSDDFDEEESDEEVIVLPRNQPPR